MNQAIARIGFFIAAAAAGSAAQADCSPVIGAYGKAEATGRYGMYDAATMQTPPKGTPFYVHVGGAGYINTGKQLQRNDAGGAGFEGSSLKDRERKGQTRCESLGDGKVGNEAATGYRIRDVDGGKISEAMAVHMWIGKASGMPLYHALGGDEHGERWVYGNDVAVPAGVK